MGICGVLVKCEDVLVLYVFYFYLWIGLVVMCVVCEWCVGELMLVR